MTPLLSVVIPAYKRSLLLQRAITSALYAAPDGDVEVVVVPNGPDVSWQSVAEVFRNDPRVRWHSLAMGNACGARNHGLGQANGKYVRFLDDDDYLYPAAVGQLELIESQEADICSAPLENILPDGRRGPIYCLPDSDDFPTAAFLSIGISGLTQGSIFRKTAIQGARWREDVVLYDDYLWMLGLAEEREMVWFQSHPPVGAYVQHHNTRLSRIRRSSSNSQQLVESVLKLHSHLSTTARVTHERTHAAATALLTHAHSAFPSSPFYLGKTIQLARSLDPSAVPIQTIFHSYPWLSRDLLATEWTMIAPRYITRGYRRASWSLRNWMAQLTSDT